MKSKKTTCGCGHSMPPSLKHVKIYFDQKAQIPEAAEQFYRHYKSRGWKTEKGCSVRNWKAAANNWIWQHRTQKPMTIEIKLKLQFPEKSF